MDDGGPTASYIIFFVLLLIDMLFYGFGAAVRELSAKELSEEFKDTKNKKAKRLYTIAVNPEQYISTVQLVVTLINLVMGGFFLRVFSRAAGNLIEKGILDNVTDMAMPPGILSVVALILSGAVLLYILLTFGVLIPKRLGTRYASKWAYACINPIYYITKIVSPVTGLVAVTAKGVLRIFGIRCEEDTEDVTEEEIISMVNEGHEQGVLLATEAEMITNIFELGDKEAKDIMTHRTNVLAIDRNMPLEEALDYMLSESKSRFPVYEENIDHIVGILHLRDAMRFHREMENMAVPVGDIEGLVRDAIFVPETKNIDVLFQNMQHTKSQMVIVVDEYGQTSGLVAMEDILEEIVGNIMDEYDEEEEHIEETGNADEYIIEGITPLEELEERFHISFKEDAFETLNGFMISKMDKIPEEDEEFSIDVDGYCFKILQVKNRMIQSVLVTKVVKESEPCAAEEETENRQDKPDKKEKD
ncbi:HlyC/CorC family transporter [Parablautia intestinalis]|uniref:HlyC/CorC family transporter n=1 Tax=Parablautia intestinalis TaxID=2320100 RepID=A0A3A9AF62_9FIRM|nr:hemolysin family protein [Parablautia intestinalis]MCI8616430.1 HlyC/CorC family transporter [Lachnospiraceae bacterium]RKI90029.1 HlyC/CorC family transporter [Parablautia intestinalis]